MPGLAVRIVDPASGTVTPAVTIDESYDPGRAWHEGVMGLALHPELMRGTGHDHVFVPDLRAVL